MRHNPWLRPGPFVGVIVIAVALAALLALSGATGLPTMAAQAQNLVAQATPQVFLPHLAKVDRPLVAPESQLCRLGVGSGTDIAQYPVADLRISWYVDWLAAPNPARPGGITHIATIRLKQTGSTTYQVISPNPATLESVVKARPGSVWIIGNEPDRRHFQDDIEPQVYARAYHDLYQQIKGWDARARIAAGNIVQPTPLRLQYLNMVLDTYQTLYNSAMPVDIWSIHTYPLNEQSCNASCPGADNCWGADIPPGIDVCQGTPYTIDDSARPEIFQQFVTDFRQWMASHGYQDRPLILPEWGVLMPPVYVDADRVKAYMNATMNYIETAIGPTGYPADGNHLVQRAAWYSLTDTQYNGWLYDPATKARTTFGDNFAAQAAAIKATLNLKPLAVKATPGASHTVALRVDVSNSGNFRAATPFVVRFYDGPPANGRLIGADQWIESLEGCGFQVATATVTWTGASSGEHTVYAVIDAVGQVPETDESDNQLSVNVTVP